MQCAPRHIPARATHLSNVFAVVLSSAVLVAGRRWRAIGLAGHAGLGGLLLLADRTRGGGRARGVVAQVRSCQRTRASSVDSDVL
jgi:hypothetical protein